MQEWLNWPLSKSGVAFRHRGFESLSLRHTMDKFRNRRPQGRLFLWLHAVRTRCFLGGSEILRTAEAVPFSLSRTGLIRPED